MKRILLKSTIENWEHTLTKHQIIESHERLRELLEESLRILNRNTDDPSILSWVNKTRKELT